MASLAQPAGASPLANPPRTARSSCCVKNERPCRFLGLGSSGHANPAKSRSFRTAITPGAVSKTSRRTKPGNNHASRAEAQSRGDGPQFRRPCLRFAAAAASLPRPSSNPHRPQTGALSSSIRGSPEGSLTRSRCRMSILRSTSDGPFDERRCRRNRSPRCPRVERGARARSVRSLICATTRASAK